MKQSQSRLRIILIRSYKALWLGIAASLIVAFLTLVTSKIHAANVEQLAEHHGMLTIQTQVGGNPLLNLLVLATMLIAGWLIYRNRRLKKVRVKVDKNHQASNRDQVKKY
ncbi:putative rosolvase [Weissella oryzae SG25]|uniref:Putative rosolvase n=1 Tax=Weissella oryzae (strain DSM 25784 / JCM 18191 / LMG 30913 / SG25) TaxID=1329250 RepID=A0A069CUM9_WEIOS|nr:hypothetical protein [Weissella oryzae]GAK31107.1 putative rosolvase [Weissella oryzae SG25]